MSCEAEVVDLTMDNYLALVDNAFEPRDWLIMFYAPWCEYSRKLQTTFEEVSDILYGEINVGKIDVPKERQLSSKFEVPGFPVIKMVHLGKSYTFKGRRSREELVEFARNGYQIHQPEDIRASVGVLSDIAHIYSHANKKATKDLLDGNFLTLDIYLTFLPVVGICVIALLLLIPVPKPTDAMKAAFAKKWNASNKYKRINGKTTSNTLQKSPFDVVNGRKAAAPTAKSESSILSLPSKYD